MENFIFADTDIGRKRKINEDSILSSKVNDPDSSIEYVLLVADGMGGADAGEIASGKCRDIMKDLFVNGNYKKFADEFNIHTKPQTLEYFRDVLREAIIHTNRFLKRSVKSDSMGTTLTIALIFKKISAQNYRNVIVGHVGDTRAYVIENKTKQNSSLQKGLQFNRTKASNKTNYTIRQITEDHSVVWAKWVKKEITKDELRTIKGNNVLTQAIGRESFEKPAIYLDKIGESDILLLSSDGLHGLLPDERLKHYCTLYSDSRQIINTLIKAANTIGGKDNISACVFSESFKQHSSKKKFKSWDIVIPVVSFLLICIFAVLLYVFYFSVMDAPILSKPNLNEIVKDITPIFEWRPAKDADKYQIQISSTKDFKKTEKDTTIVGSKYTVQLDYDSKYFWRVRAIPNEKNKSDNIWSDISEFFTPKNSEETSDKKRKATFTNDPKGKINVNDKVMFTTTFIDSTNSKIDGYTYEYSISNPPKNDKDSYRFSAIRDNDNFKKEKMISLRQVGKQIEISQSYKFENIGKYFCTFSIIYQSSDSNLSKIVSKPIEVEVISNKKTNYDNAIRRNNYIARHKVENDWELNLNVEENKTLVDIILIENKKYEIKRITKTTFVIMVPNMPKNRIISAKFKYSDRPEETNSIILSKQ